MSREEKINKMIEEIKIRRNDEQYKGGPFPIYHIEFDILNEEIERLNNKIQDLQADYGNKAQVERDLLKEENKRLNNIIKEVREFIYENAYDSERQNCIDDLWGEIPKLLEILDKGE